MCEQLISIIGAPALFARQYGQAQLKRFTEDVTNEGTRRQQDAASLAEQEQLNEETKAASTPITPNQQSSGPSRSGSNVRGLFVKDSSE